MRTVGELIRSRRQELGLTLQEVALAVGCAKSYLSTIENDRREHPPSRSLLQRLERALRMAEGALVSVGNLQVMPEDVRREVLSLQTDRSVGRRLAEMLSREGVDALHRSGELRRLVERLAPGQGAEGQSQNGGVALATALPLQAPVINKVAAGYPTEFTDLGYPARVADEYVSVPDVYDADAFAARVVGDSMSPQYFEGDIVVFSPAAATKPGSDCFVRFERDAETTFKRVYFERDAQGRELIRLQPLNASYPPRTVEREEVAGLYAAVYVVRAVGGRKGSGIGDQASGIRDQARRNLGGGG